MLRRQENFEFFPQYRYVTASTETRLLFSHRRQTLIMGVFMRLHVELLSETIFLSAAAT